MKNEKPDIEALQIIYEEVKDQWKGTFRTFQTIRERLGQIIAFIGVILSLELLGVLQIFCTPINVKFLGILVFSCIFIIISLIMACIAFRSAPFLVLDSKLCLEDDFFYKSKAELLEDICKSRLGHIKANKQILHKRATFAHVSLNTLVISIFLLAIFIIINIFNNVYYILLFFIIAVLVTLICYLLEHKTFSKLIKLN